MLGRRIGPRPFACQLSGVIASTGFSSGHRFVVGIWTGSPLGAMADVMWAKPDGERVLLVGREEVGRFITAVYRFDAVEVVPLACAWDGRVVTATAGDVSLTMRAGRRWPFPPARLRPAWVTRWVEAPVARLALGVRTFGVSPSGVREWYRADAYHRVVEARGSVGGEDLGSACGFSDAAAFGFSEPPKRPSVVEVRPLLVDRSGRLRDAVDAARPR